MASINISGYTFSTTSVPTTPALKVESGTGTYYVNLTTGQRPAALSYQKVFTISTTNYSFLRAFVTSNSLTGYSGVSNNSTLTTGYSGVSNNSTVTTGYAGVSNNSTVTTGYSGVSKTHSVDSITRQVFMMSPGVSTYSYDTRFISDVVYEYTDTTKKLIDPDIEYRKDIYAPYFTSYTSFVYIPDGYNTMQFLNNGFGGYNYVIGTNAGHTYSTSPGAFHAGPIGAFSGDFHIYDYIPRNIFYTIRYNLTDANPTVMALGWVYTGGTISLRSSGYRPFTPYAGFTYGEGKINVYARSGASSGFSNCYYAGNTSLHTITITSSGLIVSGTLNSSSTAVGNLSNTTALTNTATRYSSSVAVGNLSNTTALTNTATRYSSSTAKAYLSSITNLTVTATRYSSSTTVGNLSSTTELRTITRL